MGLFSMTAGMGLLKDEDSMGFYRRTEGFVLLKARRDFSPHGIE